MSNRGNISVRTNSLTQNFQDGLSSTHLRESKFSKTVKTTSRCKGCGSGSSKPGNQHSKACNVNVNVPITSDVVHNAGRPCQVWRVKGFHSKVFVQSSNWFPQHHLSGNYSQHLPRVNQIGAQETGNCEKLRLKSHCSFGCENNCYGRKGLAGDGGNFFWHYNKPVFSQRISFKAPYQLRQDNSGYVAQRAFYSNQSVVTQGLYQVKSCPDASAHLEQNITGFGTEAQGGLQPFRRMKIPWINHVVGGSFHSSVERKTYSRFKLYNDNRIGYSIPCATKALWVPIGTKGSGMMETTCPAGIYDVQLFSCNELTSIEPKGNVDLSNAPKTQHDSRRLTTISGHKITSVQSEASKFETSFAGGHKAESANNDMACEEKPKDIPQFIGSQVAVEALNASCKLQLLSQSIQLIMGHPLAEIERFLHSSSPIVTSFYIHEKCSVCFDNKKNCSLCERRIPNASLCSVWNWYEKPGNYGLEVKAEGSQNLKGLLSESISFHFVPSLSAVQLFGYKHLPDSCDKDQRHMSSESETKNKNEVESHSVSSGTMSFNHFLDIVSVKNLLMKDTKLTANFHSVNGPTFLSELFHCNGGDGFSFISLPACSGDSELVYEFFESEQPHQRKPLHMKIMELIAAGTSDPQSYGDPSKLGSFSLHALHPASWFSVAWYPIYQIPEGNFRASFLTYHSLGQFIGKCIPIDSHNKKMAETVFPVIGLQSYNAQSECWFELRTPGDYSSKESMDISNSEILRARLGKLQENALLLSRGCVKKDKANIVNRHPDYEFFISRKH